MAANIPKVEFLTPVGRLVEGDLFELNTTDQDGKPLKTQNGEDKVQSYFAVAFRKDDNSFDVMWRLMVQMAHAGYPNLIDAVGNKVFANADFSWKYVDGDGADTKGQPYSRKEGWAGHWVVKFTSSYLPRCFAAGKYDRAQQLTDPRSIKLGDFVRVNGTISPNIGAKSPGIYVNADMVELSGTGPEIFKGKQASDAFGSSAPVLPQGAAPLGQIPMAQSQGPGGPGGPGNTQQGPGSMGTPGSAVTPNNGFVQQAMGTPQAQGPGAAMGGPGAGMQQQQGPGGFPFNPNGAAQQQQQQPQLVPTAKAGQYTLADFRANNFTDQQLVDQGFFVWQ